MRAIADLLIVTTAVASIGCGSLLPTKQSQSKSPWESFGEARQVVGKIQLGITTKEDLKSWGIDLDAMPNVKHLTYLDVARKFGMVGGVTDGRINIPAGVLKLVAAGDKGRAYELEARVIKESRTGNFALDWLNFRKNRHKTGWEFKVFLIVINDKIEYVLYSGTPAINTVSRERNPLGPLQSLGGSTAVSAAVEVLKD
jgi:hypothetical protein